MTNSSGLSLNVTEGINKNHLKEKFENIINEFKKDMKNAFKQAKVRYTKTMTFSRYILKIVTPTIAGAISFAFAATALASFSPDFATNYPIDCFSGGWYSINN